MLLSIRVLVCWSMALCPSRTFFSSSLYLSICSVTCFLEDTWTQTHPHVFIQIWPSLMTNELCVFRYSLIPKALLNSGLFLFGGIIAILVTVFQNCSINSIFTQLTDLDSVFLTLLHIIRCGSTRLDLHLLRQTVVFYS